MYIHLNSSSNLTGVYEFSKAHSTHTINFYLLSQTHKNEIKKKKKYSKIDRIKFFDIF